MSVSRYASLSASGLSFRDIYGKVADLNQEFLHSLTQAYDSERYAKAVLLKLSNLVLLRTQYTRRHSRLIAKPLNVVVDPSNACQLKCPGCLHREGGDLSAWDKSRLKEQEVDGLLRNFGPYAVFSGLFNWGEPLINRNTSEYIGKINRYLIDTRISSNLSLSFDVEKLVASGLQTLVLSVDGVTQGVLEKYRRGVRAELVFENMRKIVALKKKLKSNTPHFIWQFLMFEHNLHEASDAETLAKAIGVNQISFVRPYNFRYRNVVPATNVENRRVVFHQDDIAWKGRLRIFKDVLCDAIDEEYESFMNVRTTHSKLSGDFGSPAKNLCRWLYEQTVMDANGRIMPCTAAPMSDFWFFTHISADDVFNSPAHISARNLSAEISKPCDRCHMVEVKPNLNSTVDVPGFLAAVDFSDRIPVDGMSALWLDHTYPPNPI
ncbi:MAG: radical SAM protein [Rhodopila sp.]|jgi:radical SAM protein with 4Fe4S-binding SPASM domain